MDYPDNGDFTVEFILKEPKKKSEQSMIDEAFWFLNYHIVERQLWNPASYLRAYCGMTANVYGPIHLSIYNTKNLT